MKSGERKRSSMQKNSSNVERPSRASQPRSRDAGTSEPCSGVTCGKGQRDEVGHSGIYPASAAEDAPDDAEVITPGEFGRTRARE
jgi:hypothetical protein